MCGFRMLHISWPLKIGFSTEDLIIDGLDQTTIFDTELAGLGQGGKADPQADRYR